MPVLDVIANRLLESSMKGDLKAIQWVDQSDQEATANEMAKHGEAEDIGLPNKEALRLLGEGKTSSQRTSSASVIPFRASANELSMTARNYGKDSPEFWEGHPRIMGRIRRNYDHDTPKLTARRAPYCAPARQRLVCGGHFSGFVAPCPRMRPRVSVPRKSVSQLTVELAKSRRRTRVIFTVKPSCGFGSPS
jgi:hypothetical protein